MLLDHVVDRSRLRCLLAAVVPILAAHADAWLWVGLWGLFTTGWPQGQPVVVRWARWPAHRVAPAHLGPEAREPGLLCRFRKKPRAALGLVDPVLQQTGGSDIGVIIASVVGFKH